MAPLRSPRTALDPRRGARSRARSLTRSRRGEIEGLSLELVISLLIVGVGLSIAVGYLTYVQDQHLGSLQVLGPTGGPTTFLYGPFPSKMTVRAYDTAGSPLPGADVRLSGGGVSLLRATAGNGTAFFSIDPTFSGSSHYASLEVTVTYSPHASLVASPPESLSTSVVVYQP